MQARSRKSTISIITERTLHLLIKATVASHTHNAHVKLAFSTLAHDTLGIIPLAAGVVTTLRTSTKNSVRELIDYTTYVRQMFAYPDSAIGFIQTFLLAMFLHSHMILPGILLCSYTFSLTHWSSDVYGINKSLQSLMT